MIITLSFFFRIISFFSVCFLCSGDISKSPFHHLPKHHLLEQAIKFITKVQNPMNCTNHDYIYLEIGLNAGFAAQFHMMAAKFMRHLAAGKFRVPVVIKGSLPGYSKGKECQHVDYDWTCYFQPASECQNILLETGKRVNVEFVENYLSIPEYFQSHGLVFWWGAIQHYLFRINDHIEHSINSNFDKLQFLKSKDFPVVAMAGLHVRHGDKHVDGFEEHSLTEELGILKKSKDCEIINQHHDCFVYINFTDHRHSHLILKMAQNNIVPILRENDIDNFNKSSRLINGFNTSDSFYHLYIKDVLNELKRNTSINLHSIHDVTHMVYPMEIFIASDDIEVLKIAKSSGFIIGSVGKSQQSSTNGMLNTLWKKPEWGYNATLEILSDIYFLSRCSTLVGVAASQVFRMSVALSNVTGRLKYADILDRDRVSKIKKMSDQYDLPFPETFD